MDLKLKCFPYGPLRLRRTVISRNGDSVTGERQGLPRSCLRAAALLLGFPGRPGDPEPGAEMGAHAPEAAPRGGLSTAAEAGPRHLDPTRPRKPRNTLPTTANRACALGAGRGTSQNLCFTGQAPLEAAGDRAGLTEHAGSTSPGGAGSGHTRPAVSVTTRRFGRQPWTGRGAGPGVSAGRF